MSAKPSFFTRRAIVVLMIVFFLVPFALRGARMAVQGMKNDVKDWLPKDFEETAWLDWFRQHFISDQFVLVSWENCHGDQQDERFKLFLDKLNPELPPSLAKQAQLELLAKKQANLPTVAYATLDSQASAASAPESTETETGAAPEKTSPTKYLARQGFLPDELGLYLAADQHEDWGGKKERWLRGRNRTANGEKNEAWYYITPDGDLYRWDAVDAPVASLGRVLSRMIYGKSVEGTLIASFGPVDGPWYHSDPRRLRAQLFKSVTTGPGVLESLVGPGGELSDNPAEALRRLKGTLIGPDGKQTCLVLTLTDAAKLNLHLVLGRGMLGKPRGQLYEIANQCNITDKALWMGGPPVDNVAIDEEGSITLVRLIGLCAALGIGLSYLCFRSFTATIMVFFIGGISAVLSLAFVYWFNSSVDAILMSMPALVYVLGLSGASHIINYYHQAVEEHGYEGAPGRAIAHAWRPSVMCNITTAIGLISLLTSELIPIQKFGLYAALGVMATLIILFTYLPAALQIWPQKPPVKKAPSGKGLWMEKSLDGMWASLGGFIIRHNTAVALGCTAIIIVFGLGVAKIKTSVNMLKMFNAEAKIIKDYEDLEHKLGPLVPMEIVISIPKEKLAQPLEATNSDSPTVEPEKTSMQVSTGEPASEATARQIAREAGRKLDFLERMEIAARVQKVIEQEFGPEGRKVVGCSMSAASFVRPLPGAAGDTSSYIMRKTTGRKLMSHREDFLHSDYLREDQNNGAELWRVSLRIPATQGVDYGVLIEELKEAVEPVLTAQRQRDIILQATDEARVAHPTKQKVSRVLLVGMPENALPKKIEKGSDKAKTVAAEVAAASPATALPAETASPELTKIDQTRIFAQTLYDLMKIKRFKVGTLVPGKDDIPQDWSATLKQYDCVVLLDDAPGCEFEALRQLAHEGNLAFVDARKHQFDPALSAKKSAAAKAAGKAGPKSDAQADLMAVYTGVVPIVYKAQRSLLDSLIQSTLWSFLTITPLMMYISRSFGAGAVAMLPNVLPVVMVFGGMGWLGIDVDVGSMMTASIALGVAVDDTIHYLTWFREELDRVGDRNKAILAAYRHCATPTFQAAVISGLGLSIFALSTFTPTQRFGYLMLAILWMGVAAELIFFPALLAGPLGRVFQPRKKAAGASQDESHGEAAAEEQPVAAEDLSWLENEEATDPSEDGGLGTIEIPGRRRVDPAQPQLVPPPIPAHKSSTLLRVLRHDGTGDRRKRSS